MSSKMANLKLYRQPNTMQSDLNYATPQQSVIVLTPRCSSNLRGKSVPRCLSKLITPKGKLFQTPRSSKQKRTIIKMSMDARLAELNGKQNKCDAKKQSTIQPKSTKVIKRVDFKAKDKKTNDENNCKKIAFLNKLLYEMKLPNLEESKKVSFEMVAQIIKTTIEQLLHKSQTIHAINQLHYTSEIDPKSAESAINVLKWISENLKFIETLDFISIIYPFSKNKDMYQECFSFVGKLYNAYVENGDENFSKTTFKFKKETFDNIKLLIGGENKTVNSDLQIQIDILEKKIKDLKKNKDEDSFTTKIVELDSMIKNVSKSSIKYIEKNKGISKYLCEITEKYQNLEKELKKLVSQCSSQENYEKRNIEVYIKSTNKKIRDYENQTQAMKIESSIMEKKIASKEITIHKNKMKIAKKTSIYENLLLNCGLHNETIKTCSKSNNRIFDLSIHEEKQSCKNSCTKLTSDISNYDNLLSEIGYEINNKSTMLIDLNNTYFEIGKKFSENDEIDENYKKEIMHKISTNNLIREKIIHMNNLIEKNKILRKLREEEIERFILNRIGDFEIHKKRIVNFYAKLQILTTRILQNGICKTDLY